MDNGFQNNVETSPVICLHSLQGGRSSEQQEKGKEKGRSGDEVLQLQWRHLRRTRGRATEDNRDLLQHRGIRPRQVRS